MKKAITFLICLTALIASAAPSHAARHHRVVARNWNHSRHWNGARNWNTARHWRSNWGWHNHRRVIFSNSFGYPFFGYPSFYSYGYYPAPYYPYAYGPRYNFDFQYNQNVQPDYRNNGHRSGSYNGNGNGNYNNNGNAGGDRARGNTSTVAKVQQQLAHEGYYKGDIDGAMGSRTHYAIRAYKRAHNLTVDGEIDEDLLGALNLR